MSTTITPFILPATGWAGSDGNWSTFQINVGTPPQSFEVVPSITGGEAWVPTQDYCVQAGFANCSTSRGIEFVNGTQSQGFQSNASSTWDLIGLYDLTTAEDLFGDSNAGYFGLDEVSIGDSPAIPRQMVAGIATPDFWLGSLPLGAQPSNFDVEAKNVGSFLYAMKANNMTPSAAYGLASGASYRSSPGALVIGGFDRAAFEPSNISFVANYAASRSLTVNLARIAVTNTNKGTISLPIDTQGLNMSIDSSVAQLWLPGTVCDNLADSLGLMYDPTTELYLISSTNRSNLISLSPEFTFTLAASSNSNVTTNIVFPYAAFDMQIGLPIYNTTTYYFPIRRAMNETQYVLGRTFLQEAHLVVDWERQNFTLGQSLHQSSVSGNLSIIIPPVAKSSKSGLSVGSIAGIVIGGVAAVTMVCAAALLWWHRRSQRRKEAAEAAKDSDTPSSSLEKQELDGRDVMELPSPIPLSGYKELDSPHPTAQAELSAGERAELENSEMTHQLMSSPVYELPGDETGHGFMSDKPDAPVPEQRPARRFANFEEVFV